MDLVCIGCGWLLLAVGLCGCFVPVIPGPAVAYSSLFVALLVGDHSSPTVTGLVVAGAVTAVVTVLDYIVPAWGAAKFHCSRGGTVGCFIGTLVGLFFMPVGILAGPFLGALAGELIAGKRVGSSLFGAFGALVGFLTGVLLKVACCGFLGYCFYSAVTR